jgi:hypothetical protein
MHPKASTKTKVDASDLDDALIAAGRPGIYEKPLFLMLNSFNYLWFLSWFNVASFYGKMFDWQSNHAAQIGLAILLSSNLLTWVAMYLNHRAFLLYSVAILHGQHSTHSDDSSGSSDVADARSTVLKAGMALKVRAARTGLTDRSIAQVLSASTFVAVLILNASLQQYLNKEQAKQQAAAFSPPPSPSPTPVASGFTAAPTAAPTAPQGGLTDPGEHGWWFWQWSLYLSVWIVLVLVLGFKLLDRVKANHSLESVHTRSVAVIVSTLLNLGSYLAALAIRYTHCTYILYTAHTYCTLQYITVHYSTLQYITVYYSTLQYTTVHAVYYSTLQYTTVHAVY